MLRLLIPFRREFFSGASDHARSDAGLRKIHSLEERLAQEVEELHRRAKELSSGQDRKSLLRRAQQHEEAAHMSEWLTPKGLRASR
ncbi:hypothetical protein ACVWY2_004231 [Bradyrhizobium sp. JR6.1]